MKMRDAGLFALVAALLVLTGMMQSWNLALQILNMGLISAIMSIGVNMQWGYAGLFNVGIMGFVALGGLASVLVSMPPVPDAWAAGGLGIIAALLLGERLGPWDVVGVLVITAGILAVQLSRQPAPKG